MTFSIGKCTGETSLELPSCAFQWRLFVPFLPRPLLFKHGRNISHLLSPSTTYYLKLLAFTPAGHDRGTFTHLIHPIQGTYVRNLSSFRFCSCFVCLFVLFVDGCCAVKIKNATAWHFNINHWLGLNLDCIDKQGSGCQLYCLCGQEGQCDPLTGKCAEKCRLAWTFTAVKGKNQRHFRFLQNLEVWISSDFYKREVRMKTIHNMSR